MLRGAPFGSWAIVLAESPAAGKRIQMPAHGASG
jgi:hypothetical protein